MSTAVQVQQQSLSASARSVSCTPMLPGFRWHQRREDFRDICRGDWVNADALRVLENVTNKLINKLRSKHGIPENQLPHKEDLWISEMRLDDFEHLSLKSTARSTFARSLHEVSAKKNKPSLVELGFLSIRFVAWAGIDPELPDTTIYLGKRDKHEESFILVDANGEYIDSRGVRRSAVEEGWTAIEKQFRYEVEAVNKALARLAGKSPPQPMKRWHSLQKTQKKVGVSAHETTKSTARDAQYMSTQTTAAQGVSEDDEISDVLACESELCTNKHNINGGALSLENAESFSNLSVLHNNSAIQLRTAQWTPETLIALVAHILAVPDPAQIDEDQWRRDWLEPAQWLMDYTADLDCTRAWEIIERHVVGMLNGPTWYAQKRARKTAFTLRHVVGADKNTAQLTGNTWHVVENELNTAQWYPDAHIDYFGPPLFDEQSAQTLPTQDYAQGYTAQAAQSEEPTAQSDAQSMETAHYVESTAQVLGDDAQTEPVVEVVAGEECAEDQVSSAQSVRTAQGEEEAAQSLEIEGAQGTQGMSWKRTDALIDMIARDSPMIHADHKEISPGLYLVGIEIALNQWFYFDNIIDWSAPLPATQRVIAKAEHYGQQRQATNSNTDSQGPPGSEV